MNSQERFHAVMNFEPCDRTLLWEFGYWAGAVRRWYTASLPQKRGIPRYVQNGEAVAGEGLPWPWYTGDPRYGADPAPRDKDVHEYFGLDAGLYRIPANYLVYPPFEWAELEDEGDTLVVQDGDGVTKRVRKDRASVPQSTSWPIMDRESFERVKAERLQPRLEERLPKDWARMVEDLKVREHPVGIGWGWLGMYGSPRHLIGEENLLVMFYDEPQLIHDLLDHLTDLWIAVFDRILKDVKPDCALLWEDMCYKNGSIISPQMVKEFLVPYYKKVTSFLRENGVNHIHLDTDGNCWELIPLFVEAGITGVYPWEVQSGMDVVEVRKAFPKLEMLGGLDKRNLALDEQAVDEELDYKLPFMLERGGYIPCADHMIPPESKWEVFAHYRRRIEELARAYSYHG